MRDALDEDRAVATREEVYPSKLRSREWWINWVKALPFDGGEVDTDATPTKQPVAPYDTGHGRPVRWHSGLDDDEHPATEFLDVIEWDGLALGTDIETHERVVSDEIGIGIIIPVGGGEQRQITLLDWDDVREPETGDIHPVCAEALRRCDGFAEISQSGEGIHQFVFGEIPGGLSKFLRHIDDEPFVGDSLPMLEMYNSGRVCAMTGDHVAGTGQDVADGQDMIDDLCREFGLADNNSPGVPTDPFGRRVDPDCDVPSHEETAEAMREAVAYDGDDPAQWDVPDDEPIAYHAVLRARERSDELASTANWELLGYAAALAYHNDISREQLLADLEAHPTPQYGFDEGRARKEIRGVWRKAESGNHEPPAMRTLVNKGLLPDDYDEPRGWSPSYDVTAEAEAVASATDGGTEAATSGDAGPGRSTFERFKSDVRGAISAVEDDDEMTQRTARHRIAQAFVTHYNFVYPEEEVRGWRTVLYVYDDEAGIYEPRGQAFVEKFLERAAGDFVSNQVVNEVVGKIERMTTERGSQFERDPERIVVANGVLDLHTGELDPFTPTEYHRTKLDVAWNPDAGEPTAIDEFLHDIVEDADVPTLYRLIAHTIYKEYVGEKAAILIGSGQNGKSMFLDLIEAFLGGHNVTHRELQDFDDDGFAANNLEGKLANLATEIGEQTLSDTTTFKKLTGRDTMDAPVKFEKPVTFENYATLMFATNEMPVFGQDNHAIWRRWVYVDFPYTFDADDISAKDPIPKHVLKRRLTQESELEALLVRCQQEIQRWHEDHDERWFADAMPPEQVRDKMKKAAEPVYNFASVCLDVGDPEETYVGKETVRAAYRAYAAEEDLPTIPENEFGSRLIGLRDLQIEATQRRIEGSPSPVYAGVELSSRGRQVLGIDATDDDEQSEVDDTRQATAVVMDELRLMVEENDNEPVPRNGLVWRVAGKIGKATAERAVDSLAEDGRLIDGSDGVLPAK